MARRRLFTSQRWTSLRGQSNCCDHSLPPSLIGTWFTEVIKRRVTNDIVDMNEDVRVLEMAGVFIRPRQQRVAVDRYKAFRRVRRGVPVRHAG